MPPQPIIGNEQLKKKLCEPEFLTGNRSCSCDIGPSGDQYHAGFDCGAHPLVHEFGERPRDPEAEQAIWDQWKTLVDSIAKGRADLLHAWVASCIKGEMRMSKRELMTRASYKHHLLFAPVLVGDGKARDVFVAVLTKLFGEHQTREVSEFEHGSDLFSTTRLIICKNMDYEAEHDTFKRALEYSTDTDSLHLKIRQFTQNKEKWYYDGAVFKPWNSSFTPYEKQPITVIDGDTHYEVVPRSQLVVLAGRSVFDVAPFEVFEAHEYYSEYNNYHELLSRDDLCAILCERYAVEFTHPSDWVYRSNTKEVPKGHRYQRFLKHIVDLHDGPEYVKTFDEIVDAYASFLGVDEICAKSFARKFGDFLKSAHQELKLSSGYFKMRRRRTTRDGETISLYYLERLRGLY